MWGGRLYRHPLCVLLTVKQKVHKTILMARICRHFISLRHWFSCKRSKQLMCPVFVTLISVTFVGSNYYFDNSFVTYFSESAITLNEIKSLPRIIFALKLKQQS